MTIRSTQFDDIYFSAEDGVAETEYVFMRGNNLPAAWQGRPYFTICETGFGTGLNFLVAWELFEQTCTDNQKHLHFISFEKYPLTPDTIKDALSPWAERFGTKIDMLCDRYPLRVSGWHRLDIAPNITLTVVFDDINNAITGLDTTVDAWFLDGFAPSKNPEMWQSSLFSAMQRCAHHGTTAATFTAAGFVKRTLSEHGFTVKKETGYGRKRDMLTATFDTQTERKPVKANAPQKIAIIGAGLGGCAAAHYLHKNGHHVEIFEKEPHIAAKASGNARGLYNPRFRKQYDPEAVFYSSGYAASYGLFKSLGDAIDFVPCGALHLINSELKKDRFPALLASWKWHQDHMEWIDKSRSADICGIALAHDAVYLADSGVVSPVKLCAVLSKDVKVHTRVNYSNLDLKPYDIVIYAVGASFKAFPELADIDMHTVRGQITSLDMQHSALPLKTVLCYGGYMTPIHNDALTCGSTFQRWSYDVENDPLDDLDNVEKLNEVLPLEHQQSPTQINGARAALRTASRDHVPVIGQLDQNSYVTTAHGSNGLLSSIMGGIILAEKITYNQITSMPASSLQKIAPYRFVKK
jgi:tRNA 5-methylaminomethyl-2-thiouridine biosynthesis bifunctional protein